MSHLKQHALILLGAICLLTPDWIKAEFGTNNRFDSFPMFTTLDPQYFLYTRTKNILKGWPIEIDEPERVSLSISPFGQNARFARDINNETIEIGELNGRWDLLTLLFGCLPQGKRWPCLLERARQGIFPDLPPGAVIDNPNYIDPNERVGFVTIPINYRKRGLRFQLEGQLIGDFGIQVQGGVIDICNTVSRFEFYRDATYPTDNAACLDQPDPCEINKYLVDEFCAIMKEIGLDTSNYHKLSCDDFRFFLYWRHAHLVNANRDASWPRFLVIPFFRIGGMAASGKPAPPNEAFAVPFGNNGSNMAGVNFGINFDFADTIEIGGEAGYSHFFEKTFCDYRVPTSCFQSGIFPFTTDVTIKPGDTWYFATKLAAEHFYDRWSFWFQYVLVEHLDDDIKLICCDPAFKPKALEDITTWKTQFLNMTLNYDYSPNIGIGFMWQQPVGWRAAPKSTTVMFTFYANF